MGIKMAPAYANIFMGKLESRILAEINPSPTYWKKYIDDIFLVWTLLVGVGLNRDPSRDSSCWELVLHYTDYCGIRLGRRWLVLGKLGVGACGGLNSWGEELWLL